MSFDRRPLQWRHCAALSVALVPLLLAGAVTLSGCGSYPAPLVTPTTFPQPATLPPANTALSSNISLSHAELGRDVCTLLPGLRVQHLVGSPVTGTTDVPESFLLSTAAKVYATGNECAYTTPSDPSSPAVLITLIVTNAGPNYNLSRLRARHTGLTIVREVGQGAFYNNHILSVMWQGFEVVVQGTPGDAHDSSSQDVALAKAVVAGLNSKR